MTSRTLFLRGLLASPLLALVCASPVVQLAPREVTTETPSFADIEPIIVDHGPLDDIEIEELLSSLSLEGPTPTEAPGIAARQDAPLALTTASIGAFQVVDIGGDICGDEQASTVTINGPLQTLHFFTGSSNMRSVKATSINGETASIDSVLEEGQEDAGEFIFSFNERITDFFVFPTESQFTGFNFTTTEGRTYSAMSSVVGPQVSGVKVPVGSGILGRIRGVACSVGVIGQMGFDFIDDIESVSVVNIDYSGFTDNALPSGPGQTVTVGSQIIDNRNSTVEQSTTISTTSAVTRQHSLTSNLGWDVGNSITISGSAGIPFLTKGSVSTTASWSLQGSTSEQDMESETVTTGGTINLKCPAGKFCVGSSFFTMFKLDVDTEITFEAKSRSGEKFTWIQKGRYEGADSLALQLRVDEADAPPA